jgi:hypothetical protein
MFIPKTTNSLYEIKYKKSKKILPFPNSLKNKIFQKERKKNLINTLPY